MTRTFKYRDRCMMLIKKTIYKCQVNLERWPRLKKIFKKIQCHSMMSLKMKNNFNGIHSNKNISIAKLKNLTKLFLNKEQSSKF